MKVYNQDKTQILTEYDLNKGELVLDKLEHLIKKVDGVEEQGHYETIAEYPNGGKDVQWVVDVAGVQAVEEHTEYEDIMVYVPFPEVPLTEVAPTEKELTEREIGELKQQLIDMDYKTSKYVDGDYTEAEWQEIVAERKAIREKIRELEKIVGDVK